MRIKDPKPDISRLDELARQVKAGDIKLPRFQRPFVWKKAEMLKLLDSIYKGYPIGSILIWHSSQKLTSERSISGLPINTDNSTHFPTDYLLDGQQRLTTLCGALFWNGEEEGSPWDIHFDLEREEFLYPKEKNLVHLFPLNKLINTSDFIRQCMKLEHHENGKRYLETAERLLQSIKDYKIAVVRIGDMSLSEVAPIFERINSTGRKLTMVDLMMAATFSEDFDLTKAIDDIKSHCYSIGFRSLNAPIILRSIAAAAELGINKEDVQKLRTKSSKELTESANSVRTALGKALTFLRERAGLHDFSYLPYGLQLTHLAEFFRLCAADDTDKLDHLVKWFWFTSATRYFGVSNSGQNSKDLARMRAYANGEINSLFEFSEIDISRLLFDRFNLRNATSTTFTLLLNTLNPKTTLDGRPIDEGHLKRKSSTFFSSFAPPAGDIRNLNISKILYPYEDDTRLSYVNGGCNLEEHLLNEKIVAVMEQDDAGRYLVNRSEVVAKKYPS